ncbi:MAG: hypothetical protein C4518_01475 [Desulfobacteraceae bacterium]|nr:MAG: hypothetical protein C4518_01475 [Desulfobacteraceae bacterium]
MKIPLNLKNHCVQTEIKRQYNRLIAHYFKLKTPEDTAEAEAGISLLQTALKSLDFGRLRSSYPELQGGGENEIFLTTGPDDTLLILINGRQINATDPNHPV